MAGTRFLFLSLFWSDSDFNFPVTLPSWVLFKYLLAKRMFYYFLFRPQESVEVNVVVSTKYYINVGHYHLKGEQCIKGNRIVRCRINTGLIEQVGELACGDVNP